MNELEKVAEKREIEICQYSTKDCLNTNDCHRCQWGVPSLDLRCSNNASFKLGAQWQAKQSPWISVEERLPPQAEHVLLKKGDYYVGFGFFGEKMIFHSVTIGDNSLVPRTVAFTHWMPIPE